VPVKHRWSELVKVCFAAAELQHPGDECNSEYFAASVSACSLLLCSTSTSSWQGLMRLWQSFCGMMVPLKQVAHVQLVNLHIWWLSGMTVTQQHNARVFVLYSMLVGAAVLARASQKFCRSCQQT
jgi:hypothetical protein